MDGYLTWWVRIPAGTTINGAVVALMQDDAAAEEGLVTAELRIDGPPVP